MNERVRERDSQNRVPPAWRLRNHAPSRRQRGRRCRSPCGQPIGHCRQHSPRHSLPFRLRSVHFVESSFLFSTAQDANKKSPRDRTLNAFDRGGLLVNESPGHWPSYPLFSHPIDFRSGRRESSANLVSQCEYRLENRKGNWIAQIRGMG